MKTDWDKDYVSCCLYNTDESKELSSYIETLKQSGFNIFGDGELFSPYIIAFNKESFAKELEELSYTLDVMPLKVIPEDNHTPYVFAIYLDDKYKKEQEKKARILEKVLSELANKEKPTKTFKTFAEFKEDFRCEKEKTEEKL